MFDASSHTKIKIKKIKELCGTSVNMTLIEELTLAKFKKQPAARLLDICAEPGLSAALHACYFAP